jgi:hypothetical protein
MHGKQRRNEGRGGTRVRLTHLGWPVAGLADPASDWPATVEYFEQAWTRLLGSLVAHCGAAHPS